jgi:hypothetical protein
MGKINSCYNNDSMHGNSHNVHNGTELKVWKNSFCFDRFEYLDDKFIYLFNFFGILILYLLFFVLTPMCTLCLKYFNILKKNAKKKEGENKD